MYFNKPGEMMRLYGQNIQGDSGFNTQSFQNVQK